MNVSIANWQVEALRLSVFPTHADDSSNRLYWKTLFPTPPEKVSRQPQLSQIVEEGPWMNARLQIEGKPGQLHWRLFAGAQNPGEAPLIGAFDSIIPPFRELMEQWLAESCPAVNRIAFGASLLWPANSLEQVCRQLSSVLPKISADLDGTRDFMFRINRRRYSGRHQGTLINRLATWSVAELVGFVLDLNSQGAQLVHSQKIDHFSKLDLDINNHPASREGLPREVLPIIFGEFVDAAREIATLGDVP